MLFCCAIRDRIAKHPLPALADKRTILVCGYPGLKCAKPKIALTGPSVFRVKPLVPRQSSAASGVNAAREFRKFTDQPLTLRGSDYAAAVQTLNKAIERASGFLQSQRMCGRYRHPTDKELPKTGVKRRSYCGMLDRSTVNSKLGDLSLPHC